MTFNPEVIFARKIIKYSFKNTWMFISKVNWTFVSGHQNTFKKVNKTINLLSKLFVTYLELHF